MFRTLIYPSSRAWDYSVELSHWSYCSWFDVCWSFGVVGLEWYPCCRLKHTHRTKNNTTNVVIQQKSRKLLLMDILMSETCWAHKKWNKIASDIKLLFYSSNLGRFANFLKHFFILWIVKKFLGGYAIRKGKCKTVPLQAGSGPEGSGKLRFPDYMTTAQDGGKVVSLTHRPPLPSGNAPGTHFCYRQSRPQGHSAIGRIMSMKNSNDTIWNRTSDLPICSTAPWPLCHRGPPHCFVLSIFWPPGH